MEGTDSVLFSSTFLNCWKWLKAKPHYHTYEHWSLVQCYVSHMDYYSWHFAVSLSPLSASSPPSVQNQFFFESLQDEKVQIHVQFFIPASQILRRYLIGDR